MLNATSAISYNNGRNYSQKAIGIMQQVLNVPTGGKWDTPTVKAVYNLQTKMKPQLTPDGKVGPLTLGAMIGELLYVKRAADADVLRVYPHQMLSSPGQNGGVNPIVDFWRVPMRPFRFEKFMKGPQPYWQAAAQFSVSVKFAPGLSDAEVLKYEYRQYIKGEAWVRTPELGWNKVTDVFKVPGGLVESAFKEDGYVDNYNNIWCYGYRQSAYFNKPNEKDLYIPTYKGREYLLVDTPALAGKYLKQPVDVWIKLDFRGEVVLVSRDAEDKSTKVQTLATKYWDYFFEKTLNYDTAISVF